MFKSDLDVDFVSGSLVGKSLDVLVTGSIAAVESIRFVRSLRRLGATVYCHLSAGAAQFVTANALSWASGGNEVIVSFTGQSHHLAERDALVIAPASASTLGKLANGICDAPGLALAASYLGSKKPVCLLPSMHDSLFNSPGVQNNLNLLSSYCYILSSRGEEGKQKFPQANVLADEVSHVLRRKSASPRPAVVLMGSAKTYLDDIRYLSNYSSGGLGSEIAAELYRYGHETFVISGHCQIAPSSYTKLVNCESNDDFSLAARTSLMSLESPALICAASLLDYEFDERLRGKIKSSEQKCLKVSLSRSSKVLADLKELSDLKIGFKLESSLDALLAHQFASSYIGHYGLGMMVLNQLSDVSKNDHRAFVFTQSGLEQGLDPEVITGKKALAHCVARFVREH